VEHELVKKSLVLGFSTRCTLVNPAVSVSDPTLARISQAKPLEIYGRNAANAEFLCSHIDLDEITSGSGLSPRRATLRSLYGWRRIDPFVFYKKLLGYFQYDRSAQFSLRCQPILVRFGFPGATGGRCFWQRKRSGNRQSLWLVQTGVRKVRAGLRVIAQFVYWRVGT
jgi:hypothetical protein